MLFRSARKNRVLAGLVLVSLAVSGIFTWLPVIGQLSSGFRIMILTIILAGAAAMLFPVEEEGEVKEHEA